RAPGAVVLRDQQTHASRAQRDREHFALAFMFAIHGEAEDVAIPRKTGLNVGLRERHAQALPFQLNHSLSPRSRFTIATTWSAVVSSAGRPATVSSRSSSGSSVPPRTTPSTPSAFFNRSTRETTRSRVSSRKTPLSSS